MRRGSKSAVRLIKLRYYVADRISKYAGKENEYLEMSIDDNIAKLVQLLDSRYVSTSMEFRPVDMAAKFQFLTLDIISEIAFGTAFGNLEADDDISSYMKTMEGMFPLATLLGTWPALAKVFFSKPLRRFLPKDTDTAGMGKLMGFVSPSLLTLSLLLLNNGSLTI